MEVLYDKINNKGNARVKPEIIRMIDRHKLDYDMLIQLSYSMVSTGVSEGQKLTALAIAIGNRIRDYYNLPRKAELSLRLGVFVLNSYALNDLVLIKKVNDYKGNKAKTVYKVFAGYKRGDLKKLSKEFSEVICTHKPLFQKADDWTSGKSKIRNGETLKIIKNAKEEVLAEINPNNTKIVLDTLNKKQSIAYTVKPKLFEVYKWALNNKRECFECYSLKTITKERANAKENEAYQILNATEPYVGKTFYQLYKYDSRARCYPLSSYLNEINSDRVKGMLSFANGKPLGPTGLEEMYHTIANHYGEDKLPHNDKVKFVENKYYEFVAMGKDPWNKTGWMLAESPFQFLNSVVELAELDDHFVACGKTEDFVSHMFNPRDGSNNGVQHLMSLSGDSKNGHLVNIRKTKDGRPGDLYTFVAEKVRDKIIDEASHETELAFKYYDLYFKTIERLRNRFRIAEANNDPRVEYKKKAIKHYQRKYKTQLAMTDVIYWARAKFTIKEWRKTLKRGCMTYSYSATRRGMGEQVLEDSKDIDNVYLANKQHSAARLLGSKVYETMETEFPEVASVMKLFKDNCDAYIRKHDKQYRCKTLISNFPFVQDYWAYKNVRIKISDGLYVQNQDKSFGWLSEFKCTIQSDLPIINKSKSLSAVSPNTIHGLDALHLQLVICACDFDIVTAHDSYSSHCCDVQDMQKVIREKFKLIQDSKPLEHILEQTGNLVPMVARGDLDHSEILDCEFAFA